MKKEKGPIEFFSIKSKPFKGVAKNIKEVHTKLRKVNLAGKSEYVWILQNPNSPEADRLKDGNHHYFLGGSAGKVAHFLVWVDGAFVEGRCWMTDQWFPTEHVVEKFDS